MALNYDPVPNPVKPVADSAMHINEASRFSGEGARRNQSGEGFNIITMNSKNNVLGQQDRQQSEAASNRGTIRSANLSARAHSVMHNILTGESRAAAPPPPQRPAPSARGPVAPWDR
eukprot:gene22330-29406_t